MIKFYAMKNGNINIQTTDKSITLATYPKYDIFTVVHYNSENELLNGYDWDDDGWPLVDTYEEAWKLVVKIKTKNNAKNHIAITSMANSIMLTTFYLYADKDGIDKEKLKLALRELLRSQAQYVKTNTYDPFDTIALQDLVDIYNLMEDEDKKNIKDNLEIYSWFEAKAPFMEFYKKIGGVIDND